MSGSQGRPENVLRVQFCAVETHKESVGELVIGDSRNRWLRLRWLRHI